RDGPRVPEPDHGGQPKGLHADSTGDVVSAYADLAGLVTFRPLSTPLPAPTYSGNTTSPFSASWTSTVELLVRELRHLKPRQTILEVDLREQDLRQARTPGVILTPPVGARQAVPSTARGAHLVAEHGSVKAALLATHPDRGGDPAQFRDVQAYRDGGQA
ncbi:MAG: hypothetical protein JWM10_787, partial [Myxococcaceae bacterium]|nr:hypothetical protein [Myxococcaceae bacterium]